MLICVPAVVAAGAVPWLRLGLTPGRARRARTRAEQRDAASARPRRALSLWRREREFAVATRAREVGPVRVFHQRPVLVGEVVCFPRSAPVGWRARARGRVTPAGPL